ncbi:hypothetical protein QLS71_015785 [Mariniflexile litorale]|uniref:STAS/SEC14 domain-containing protein n=1 Tax=Mariniflexile litorale TaxID=3045158 RepID=A0AAU7EE97_9FLAO|nr:hypothetical protein [Mariniflexile sp. KMM 9835]MDQ8212394.1 hypothetical protein [Mariniflexile sp. KMM 9835]
MKFENSQYFKIKHYKIERPFGNFYLLESFFISELNEGIHFDWEMVKSIMDELIMFYGSDAQIGYISNRFNSYSLNPQVWEEIDEKYGIMVAAAIVTYNPMAFMNATLEKQFYKKSIKRCDSLEVAFQWISNLRELKKD